MGDQLGTGQHQAVHLAAATCDAEALGLLMDLMGLDLIKNPCPMKADPWPCYGVTVPAPTCPEWEVFNSLVGNDARG